MTDEQRREQFEDESPTLEGAALLISASVGAGWIILGILAWRWLR